MSDRLSSGPARLLSAVCTWGMVVMFFLPLSGGVLAQSTGRRTPHREPAPATPASKPAAPAPVKPPKLSISFTTIPAISQDRDFRSLTAVPSEVDEEESELREKEEGSSLRSIPPNPGKMQAAVAQRLRPSLAPAPLPACPRPRCTKGYSTAPTATVIHRTRWVMSVLTTSFRA